MARAAKIYDFSIPANGAFHLLVEGSYYRILTATGIVEVRRDGGSGIGPLYPGQGEKDQNFNRITLIDKTGAANVGTIIIADNTFVDDRITGSVEVIDGGKNRTMAGMAMVGTMYMANLAANYSAVQLWNPVGSGRNLYVEQIFLTTNGASGIQLAQITAALATTGGVISSKKIAFPIGVGLINGQQSVAQQGGGTFINLPNNTIYVPKEPYQLTPGTGLLVRKNLQNEDIQASFEWFEEPI